MSIVSTAVVCRPASVPPMAVVFLLLVCASPVRAQTTDAIGVRAQGMAGAFTAVADDASGGYWNPAGIAGGPFVNGLIEYGRPERDVDETVRGFAAAYPAFGVMYYRLPVRQIRVVPTSTAVDPGSRQDQGSVSLFAGTFGQSIGDHFVIATTVKLLRADDTTGDLDVGGMVTFGPARIGATVRNITEPSFDNGGAEFTLRRHARAGFALASGRRGVVGRATVSADVDLTADSTVRGDERFLAVGGEAWAPQNSVAIRGGFRHNLVGAGQTMVSAGFSLAVRRSTFVDAYVSTGDAVRHGWGLGLRVTF
jgi:hypothetical protein